MNGSFRLLRMLSALAVLPLVGWYTTSVPLDGKATFLTAKCNNCHSIQSLGIARAGSGDASTKAPPDLSGVGLRHNADWMKRFLLKEESLNGAKHLKKFKGTDAELTMLSAWLATLKTRR